MRSAARGSESDRRPGRQALRAGFALAVICMVLVVVGASGIASRALMDLLYRLLHAHTAAIIDQAITTMLSVVIFGLVLGGIGYIGSRRKESDLLAPLVETMRQIARGNFSVDVPSELFSRSTLGPIVSGLNEMTEGLKTMERLRQEFIANVSHEIQSPLTSISGFAHALRTTDADRSERDDYLFVIEAEAKRLSRLSDDLLQLTTLDASEQVLDKGRFNLSRQLREVIVALDPQVRAKGISFDADLEEADIVADRDKLQRVWVNLLANAVKFSEPGGAISVALTSEESAVRVTIRDGGIGIDAKDLPFLFDRFFKADPSRTREGDRQGSGLGLAIVKRVVELHRGTVAVTSDGKGLGTAFVVALPKVAAGD